jgi:hypothetical protein
VKKYLLPVGLISIALSLYQSVPSAYAHDCGSPDDCSNVVAGSGIVSAILAAVLGAAAAAAVKAAKGKYKTKPQEKKFKNCNEAVDYLNRGNLPGEADAQITPKMGETRITEQPDGSFRAEVDISWSLSDESTLELPEWTWRNMTESEKEALKAFVDALRVHEEGHMKVAEEYGKEISGTQVGTGSTRSEAQKDLNNQLRKYQKRAQKELDRRRQDYDDKTKNGRKQSEGPQHGYPGGKDVRLNCP